MNSKTTLKGKNANNYLTHTNNMQGITLIALVVTIIILIILAGVSINLVLGGNGVITKAKEAKQEIEKAYNEEQEAIDKLYESLLSQSEDDTPGDITDAGKQDGSESKPYKVRSVEDFLELIAISRKDGLYDKFVDIETDLDFKNPNSYNDYNDTKRFGDYNEDGLTEGIMKELTDESKRGLKDGFQFSGTLNGNGHTISNIYKQKKLVYNSSNPIDYKTGIFYENTGTIKNLNFEGKMNVIIDNQTNAGRIGGIVAQNKHGGQLLNCTSNMQITVIGDNLDMQTIVDIIVGGIASENEDETENTKIDGCINKGKIACYFVLNSNVSTDYYHKIKIGGIVGRNDSITINSMNEGYLDITKNFYTTINSSDNTLYIGGIAGKNNYNGIIENCINTGEIKGSSETSPIFIGGIVAATENLDTCITKNVYNSGKISAVTISDIAIGGILADGYGTIDSAYNIGEISAQSSAGNIKNGGVIGDYHSSNANITNCYYKKVSGLFGAEGSDRTNIEAIENLNQTQVIQDLNTNININNSSNTIIWYKIIELDGKIKFNT